MVKVKNLSEESFAKALKEFNVAGELVGAREEEKQSLLNEFDLECKRFFFGKISEKALTASVNKTNDELHRLDKEIRLNMAKARAAGNKALKIIAAEAPTSYRATLSGISGGNAKKKKKRRAKKSRRKKKR